MKRILLLSALCFLLAGCGKEIKAKQAEYMQITADEAKAMIDGEEDYTILDVRTQPEYDEGHIEGAYLIPDTEINSRAEEELIDKDATILVYCRSGRRSKLAAQALADLGYTNVYEFGGIIDWPYETVK
jgi:phage shock protein E